MKNIILSVLTLASGSLFAGAVGGGGSSGFQVKSAAELMAVYEGANNLSRSAFGTEDQFNIDLQNRVVVFDPNKIALKKSEVWSFEEVVKHAEPAATESQDE